MWQHERLTAYARALDAAVEIDRICLGVPARRRDLRDQVQRAAASVVLNLAEGAAEFSGPEKVRFYRMSRRSAAECVATLDILERTLPAFLDTRAARTLLGTTGAMLTNLILANLSAMPESEPQPEP